MAAPGLLSVADCNVLFLRTEQGILGARQRMGLVEAKMFAPQIVNHCKPLLVERQFKLFVRLLESLGKPLNELRKSLHIQPADAMALISLNSSEVVSSFLHIGASWNGSSLNSFYIILNAHLENDRKSNPDYRDCYLRSQRYDGELCIVYGFQTKGCATEWKKLEEGSTEDDVWGVIQRALEDLSSPGRHPYVRIDLGDCKHTRGYMSFETSQLDDPMTFRAPTTG